MNRKDLIFMKKGMCISLLVLVSFVCSLPRMPQTPAIRAMPSSFGAHLSSLRVSLSQVPSQNSDQDKTDTRLMKIRKFRRRRSTLSLNVHLQQAFLSAPPIRKTGSCLPVDVALLSRIADPLVHPPA